MRQYRTRAGEIIVAGLLYPGAAALDLIGPIEAFELASRELESQGASARYRTVLVAKHAGPVRTFSGITMDADRSFDDAADDIDLVLTPGYATGAAVENEAELRGWIQARSRTVTRMVSVCSGALLFARAGLLEGKRVTTHWMDRDELSRAAPGAIVEADKVFCCDGSIYSSGGMTAGIDLALAIIEEDFGRALSLKVAKRMVVFLRRQGDQTQFSSLLSAQTRASRFGPLVDHIEGDLDRDWSVDAMAEACAMSTRNFTRQFQKTIGYAPRRYVELRRLERARTLLEESSAQMEAVARDAGYAGARQFGRAFAREFGVTPGDYRRRFGLADVS